MKNVTAIILILISIGLFYMSINPQYTKVKALRAEASHYDDILANISDLTETRDDLLVKYQAMPKEELERLGKILPSNVDTVGLAMDFDAIAGRYGISIKGIQTTQDKSDNISTIIQAMPTSKYKQSTVSFAFVASYENFRKFMQDIEQSLRIIDVKSVSFRSVETGLYDYKVSIGTYSLK